MNTGTKKTKKLVPVHTDRYHWTITNHLKSQIFDYHKKILTGKWEYFPKNLQKCSVICLKI